MRPTRPIIAICSLLLSGTPALAAESKESKPPMMAEDIATITELNYFSNFNLSAYSITVGTMEVRADKMGPPCPGTATGTKITARYDDKVMLLGDENANCKLTIRRMEYTAPPQPH